MADPNFNFRRPKRISQFLGFLYMWITYFVGIQIQRFEHDDPQVIILLILFFLLTPLFLTAVYSWVYPTRWKLTLYITAFPGCLALILQYVLMSFIPYVVVPRNVMNHLVGPPRPLDVFGQIWVSLPIVIWTIAFPLLSSLVASYRNRVHLRKSAEQGAAANP